MPSPKADRALLARIAARMSRRVDQELDA